MAFIDYKEMLTEARDLFTKGHLKQAEVILQEIILINNKTPEVFQMLATIYYDQGQFKKAIRFFRRALEIDPTYTDASVGLSIILNDLGRYDEGKKVFEEAQTALDERKKRQNDPFMEEKIAIKHAELGEIYFQYKRFNEAIEQFFK